MNRKYKVELPKHCGQLSKERIAILTDIALSGGLLEEEFDPSFRKWFLKFSYKYPDFAFIRKCHDFVEYFWVGRYY